jgi:hypothetical protein
MVLFVPVTRSAGNATWCGHSQSILLALNSLWRRVGPLSGQSQVSANSSEMQAQRVEAIPYSAHR